MSKPRSASSDIRRSDSGAETVGAMDVAFIFVGLELLDDELIHCLVHPKTVRKDHPKLGMVFPPVLAQNFSAVAMENKFALVFSMLICASIPSARAETPLETALLKAVRDVHFERVIDFGAGNESRPVKAHLNFPAQTIAHPPNVNVAVIQLDADGRMVDRAYVLLSRDYPDGLIVPLDKNAGASSVRFLRWDIERSDGGTFSHDVGHQLTTKDWTNNPPLTDADDIVPGRTNAPYQFMAPYPASLFKSLIAFHVMQMIDAVKLTLDTEHTYAVAGAKPETRKTRDWLDPMITVSDNHATGALLKMFHDRNEIEPLNREFRELNLGTLQINATSPADGLGWSPGQI